MLGRIITDDQILANLEYINHDIDKRSATLPATIRISRSEREITVIIALSHDSLTLAELKEATGIPGDPLTDILKRLSIGGL